MKRPLTYTIAALILAVPALQAKVLLISHNTPAEEAVTKLVVDEYNYNNAYPAFFEEKTLADESSGYGAFRDTALYLDETEIPDFDTLLATRMSELGLQAGDFADQGFVDFLEAQGYEVVRSTGVLLQEGEFDPQTEKAYQNMQYARPLTTELKAELNGYDLIIMSRDVGSGFAYAMGGRDDTDGAIRRIQDWNRLTVPIINMHHSLARGSEFSSGWNWVYGFTFDNPNTRTKHVRDKDAGNLIDPLTLEQEVLVPEDPIFEGVTLPENGIVDIFDGPVFKPSSTRMFDNILERFAASDAVVEEILEYVVPNFFATDTNKGFIDISTEDLLVFRPVVRRTLFTLQINPSGNYGDETPTASDLAQRIFGPRLFFAAGMGDHGIFALNELGQQIFLNAVKQYAQPTVDPGEDPESLWVEVAAANPAGDKEAGIGWLNDVAYPFIWHYSVGGWMFVLDEFSTLDAMFLYDYQSTNWFWANNGWGGWHVNLDDPAYGQAGWADWTP